MKGFKLILSFFEMEDVSNIQIHLDHLFSTSGSKHWARDTCTFCRWSWGRNPLYDAEIQWRRADEDKGIQCLHMTSHFWNGVKSKVLQEWFQTSICFSTRMKVAAYAYQDGKAGVYASLEGRKHQIDSKFMNHGKQGGYCCSLWNLGICKYGRENKWKMKPKE